MNFINISEIRVVFCKFAGKDAREIGIGDDGLFLERFRDVWESGHNEKLGGAIGDADGASGAFKVADERFFKRGVHKWLLNKLK